MASLLERKDTNMTEGGILRHLIAFSVPLLIGNIFQILYNTVDSIVVGNFVGKEALAAVGSVGPIINTLIGLFMGLATGASVVISQYYGARDDKQVHEAVQTTVVMTLILCAVCTIMGILLVPIMLRWMATPEDVYDGAALYLRIYFAGVTGLMIYNMGSGILRAVGDSRRPLFFLIISALINTVLDLVFVVAFHWGIAGVAIATVIAQFISAVLVLVLLTRTTSSYSIYWGQLRLNVPMLRRIWKIGMPSALQQAITSFSNVFVQSYINQFGSACMAGWASYGKIDQFILLPMQSLSLSTTTFVGQNFGAGKVKRAKAGTNQAVVMALISTAVLAVPVVVFSGPMISLFNADPEVLEYGSLFIRRIAPFYSVCIICQIYAGTLRGAGEARAPMIIMLSSFVVFRQIYLYVTSKLIGTLMPVVFGYPVGWVVCSIAMFIYYKYGGWEKRNLIADTAEIKDPA
jgi:putative MATE family efflux protein